MTDPLQSDRLLRKRNQSLQKQLDVTLQILSEEYRQCKDRVNKEERDCGKFLQSLYDTMPDLQSYEHPKTRSMSANALVRERLHSFHHVPADPEEGSAAPDASHHPQPPADSPSRSQRQPLAPEGKRQTTTKARNPAERSSLARATRNVSGDLGGSGPFRPVRQDSVRGKVQIPTRPKTATGCRSLRIGDPDPKPDRPRTSFGFRKSSRPSFGKNAYSEHDRSVHELVLRRFQSIFDVRVKKDSQSTASPVAVTPPATPQDDHVASDDDEDDEDDDDQKSSSSEDGKDPGLESLHDHLDASQVTGEQDCDSPKRHYCRRVVWSARPHRKFASVSAPDIDALDIPSSEHGAAVPYKPRSYSLSLPTRTVAKLHRHDLLEPSVVDSKTKTSASQRNVTTNGDLNCHSENAQPDDKSAEHNPAHIQQRTTDHHHQPPDQSQNPGRPRVLNKSKSDTNVFTKPRTARTLAHGKTNASPTVPPSSSSSPPSAHTARRRHSTLTPASHPRRRMSDSTSVLMSREQLVDRLIHAGKRSYTTTTAISPHLTHLTHLTRPKTAAGRSELSHRFVPVSRKTIVGILSEIENQKASTRTLLSTSRELQQFVKKLTPHDQLIEDEDSD